MDVRSALNGTYNQQITTYTKGCEPVVADVKFKEDNVLVVEALTQNDGASTIYNLYLNGEHILTETRRNEFTNTISKNIDVDYAAIGKVVRLGEDDYIFDEKIDFVTVYNYKLAQDKIYEIMLETTANEFNYKYSNILEPKEIVIGEDFENISTMENGTIVVKFDKQSSISSLISVGNSNFISDHLNLYVSGDRLGLEVRRNNGDLRYHTHIRANGVNFKNEDNILIVTAERNAQGTATTYEFHLNGELVLTGSDTRGNFAKGIFEANNVSIGKTIRNGGAAMLLMSI